MGHDFSQRAARKCSDGREANRYGHDDNSSVQNRSKCQHAGKRLVLVEAGSDESDFAFIHDKQ